MHRSHRTSLFPPSRAKIRAGGEGREEGGTKAGSNGGGGRKRAKVARRRVEQSFNKNFARSSRGGDER